MARCSRCSSFSHREDGANGLCDACLLEETLAADDAPAGETFGPYQVLCQIGEGGIGIVYLAEQKEPISREVALKVLKSGAAGGEMPARFEIERQALARMEHPGIARAIDAGTSSSGRPFFVMEFVDGAPITEYCDRRSVGIRERLRLFVGVCEAIEYAHRRGVLHRDIKPSNVLIAESDGRAAPRIIDFGLARALGGPIGNQPFATEAGRVLGTPEYMSPEQAEFSGRALTAASDVYSLGVLLYELLCGLLPFDSARLREGGLADAIRTIREEAPPRPDLRLRQAGARAEEAARRRGLSVAALERQLRGDSWPILRMALEKDAAHRYASAGALAEDVERYLRHDPVHAHRPGLLYRARKLVERRPALVGVGVAALAVLLAGASYLLRTRGNQPPAGPAPVTTLVTSYQGYEFQPALSRDGRRVAFVWNGDENNFDIYVKPVEGGDPLRLTRDPAHDLHPAWSPDGRSIAFVRTSQAREEVMIVPASGGSERKVLEIRTLAGSWEGDAFSMQRSPGPAWSPDGRTLAVGNTDGGKGPDSLYLVSPDTGSQRRLTRPDAASLGDSLPVFSPDGRDLAFVRAESQRGLTDIYVVPVAGGTPRRLTFDRKGISAISWTAGGRIVFISNRGGPLMLWSIPASGGKPELIPIAGRGLIDVASSPGADRLLVTEYFKNTNIWRVDLEHPRTPAKRLITSTRSNDNPNYSPDGKRIVFGSDRSGDYEMWVSDAEGLHARQLTSVGGLPVGTPRWSPDGRQIVFDTVRNGRSIICTIASEGGQPRVVVADEWDDMMPSWSRDGRFIYYASRRGSLLPIFKKPVAGGPAVQLTHKAGGDGVEAPDGKIWFSDGYNGIWQVSPNGGDERPVPELAGIRDSRQFAVTKRGAYFLGRDQPPWIIQFYDPATRRIAPVVRIEKEVQFGVPDLSVSPDDHWLLFTELDESTSDIMMLQPFR